MKHSPNESGAVTKDQIRQTLEITRSDFHTLLEAVPDKVMDRRGAGSAWTARQELWHITWGARFMLDLVRGGKRGLGLPRLPMRLVDPLNALYTRLRSRLATRHSLAKRYDSVHAAAIQQLGNASEDDLKRQITVFGEPYTTADLLLGVGHHFEEHAVRIRPLLDQSAGPNS